MSTMFGKPHSINADPIIMAGRKSEFGHRGPLRPPLKKNTVIVIKTTPEMIPVSDAKLLKLYMKPAVKALAEQIEVDLMMSYPLLSQNLSLSQNQNRKDQTNHNAATHTRR